MGAWREGMEGERERGGEERGREGEREEREWYSSFVLLLFPFSLPPIMGYSY
jgi:hypothetical protein